MMFRPVLENVISSTIFFYSAPRRRKICQIVCENINFGSKIRVPPPQGKIKNSSFLPKTYFSPGIFKSEFPPGYTYSKIMISPQNFGEKWHYANSQDFVIFWEYLSIKIPLILGLLWKVEISLLERMWTRGQFLRSYSCCRKMYFLKEIDLILSKNGF